jgi:hypothetical protein
MAAAFLYDLLNIAKNLLRAGFINDASGPLPQRPYSQSSVHWSIRLRELDLWRGFCLRLQERCVISIHADVKARLLKLFFDIQLA